MSVGLQVFGDNGVMQIDGKYRNWCFKEKRVIPVTLRTTLTGATRDVYYTTQVAGSQPTLTFYGESPMFFVESSQYVGISVSGGNGVWNIYMECNVSTSPTVYVYDREPTNIWPSDCGIKVFKEDGSLAFTSAWSPLRVVGFYPSAKSTPAVHSKVAWNFPRVEGRKYAWFQGQHRMYLKRRGDYVDWYMDRLMISGSQVICSREFAAAEWDEGLYALPSWKVDANTVVMVADVTNL